MAPVEISMETFGVRIFLLVSVKCFVRVFQRAAADGIQQLCVYRVISLTNEM